MGNNDRKTPAPARDEDIETFVSLLDVLTLDGASLDNEPLWKERAYEIAAWLPDETRREIATRLRDAQQAAQEVDVEGFAVRHGLTPAETKLLESLVQGSSLVEHAGAHGISVNTARVHMQRVLEKTGARRQANLVRMLYS